MRLQWPEIRARAAAFAERWATAHYEKGQTHGFYIDFFNVFGIDQKQVAIFERRVQNLDATKRGFMDVFIPGQLIIEQKSAGRDLFKAQTQAFDYFDWLSEAERPRFILTSDFQRFHLIDLEENRDWRFTLPELKRHVEAFWFLVGTQPRLFRNQSPANKAASKLMGELHEALKADGYTGHHLERLLVRLLFILFADHTGIFNKNQFLVFLEQKTSADGRDLGRWLQELFATLDTPMDKRQASLDPDLAAFPYVNGRLFSESIRPAAFDNAMRSILLEAAAFRWDEVSPAIFGGLFESVIDKVTQRQQGAHYTPEDCIIKLIGPLFLDDLHAEFDKAKALVGPGRERALKALHDKLAKMRLLDPACGAGNFLVIAYRELRELERELLKELHGAQTFGLDVALLSRLNVDHFFGIEIDEFPALIAETALWMTDHIANTRLAEDYGTAYARIPLVTAPGIRHADALEIDWNTVLPSANCTHVLGNPPFSGSKYQSALQRSQVRRLAGLGGSGGTLDYVAAWFLKGATYVQGGEARLAFVSTNSICQGEQVAQLWPTLFSRGVEISFAHRTFVWPGAAQVHCVIVGLAQRGHEPTDKRLFTYSNNRDEPIETKAKELSAYLFDANGADRHLVVEEVSAPINGTHRLVSGTQPIDGGFYIFDANEKAAFINVEAGANQFLRPFVGAAEYINDGARWILDLRNAPASVVRDMPAVKERMAQVRQFRSKSKRSSTLAIANAPAMFNVTVVPERDYLVIPEVSSARREYIPIGWLTPPTIPSNKLRVLLDASLWHFGILTSAMHMAWTGHIGGRLKSDYQYAVGLNYNAFPWPTNASPAQVSKIESLAQAVLDARAMPKNATSSLADLYDPDTMPAELRKAHKALDEAVDKLYRAAPFASDRARVEHLFVRYQALVQPIAAAARANARTARRVARRGTALS